MKPRNFNAVKDGITKGKRIIAAWAQAGSSITTEIMAAAGFDMILVDHEHGPGNIMTLISQIHAMGAYDAVPFVRASWNDFVQIKQILDAGAYGLLVPYVSTAEEAEAAVQAVHYPPRGIRGVAGSPRAAHYGNKSFEYFTSAEEEIMLLVAVETREAVDNIEAILAVDGVDGIFIGPVDLATNLGHLADPGHPEVRRQIEYVEDKVIASGKVLMSLAGDREQAIEKYDRGAQIVLIMSDTKDLSQLAYEKVESLRLKN